MTATDSTVPTPRDVADAEHRSDGSWLGEQLEPTAVAALADHFGLAVADVEAAARLLAAADQVDADADAAAGREPTGPSHAEGDVRQLLARAVQDLDDADGAARSQERWLADHHRAQARVTAELARARSLGQVASAQHRIAGALQDLAGVLRKAAQR